MTPGPFDPRSVCNLMLDCASKPITNLALQKLLYFAHGIHLTKTQLPLVSGYFEAWKHGPVHPGAYAAFKSARDQPILFRADSVDALTGSRRPIPSPSAPAVRGLVHRIMISYGEMSASLLRAISHTPKSPWAAVVDQAQNGVSFGMRISDSLIIERFAHHKVSVGTMALHGEPGEDAPFHS
jgi:uncharacterized phage-associated protein